MHEVQKNRQKKNMPITSANQPVHIPVIKHEMSSVLNRCEQRSGLSNMLHMSVQFNQKWKQTPGQASIHLTADKSVRLYAIVKKRQTDTRPMYYAYRYGCCHQLHN